MIENKLSTRTERNRRQTIEYRIAVAGHNPAPWNLCPKCRTRIVGKLDVDDRRIPTTPLVHDVIPARVCRKVDGFCVDRLLHANTRWKNETRVVEHHRDKAHLGREKIHFEHAVEKPISEYTYPRVLIEPGSQGIRRTTIAVHFKRNLVIVVPEVPVKDFTTYNVRRPSHRRNQSQNENAKKPL